MATSNHCVGLSEGFIKTIVLAVGCSAFAVSICLCVLFPAPMIMSGFESCFSHALNSNTFTSLNKDSSEINASICFSWPFFPSLNAQIVISSVCFSDID